ncbi:MFS transporter [Micromonospora sp. NPDC000207]|uniref:MFS transporter n=1 Tax=Micromonospora sp. NPDC000207 TaxID=3154246 RepID=UPI00331F5034
MAGRDLLLLRRLPDGPAARTFLVAVFIDAAGRGLFLAGSALFYTQVIGLTTAQVGTGLSVAALCGLLCVVPIGRVADRIGAPQTLIALQLWRGLGFFVYPFLTDFTQFLLVACFLGMVENAVTPILQSIAGSIAGAGTPVGTMAAVAVIRNAAYSLAALAATLSITLAGPAAYTGFVLANATAFVLTALLLLRVRHGLPRVAATADPVSALAALPWRDLRFLGLALLNGVLFLHMVILSVALPLWIITRTSAPEPIVGVVLLVNTVLAVTLQVRFSRGGDDLGHAGRLQRRAGVALAVFCVLAAASAGSPPAVATAVVLLAAVALTFGELWQSAGGWGVSFQLAPADRRNYYLGLYNLGASGIAVLGPGLLTVAVVGRGPVGWLVLGGVFLVTGFLVAAIADRPAREVAVR